MPLSTPPYSVPLASRPVAPDPFRWGQRQPVSGQLNSVTWLVLLGSALVFYGLGGTFVGLTEISPTGTPQ